MILKFCEDNFLFYITHTKYFDILCYFVIFLFISLFILVQKNEFIDKLKKSNLKMVLIVLFFGIFVGFLVFLFTWLLNKNSFNGCSTRYYQNISFKAENKVNNTVNKLKKSKVIIVGDSRMQLINDDKETEKPFNFEFVAKGGSKIDWLKDIAIDNVDELLENDDFNYYVVVNMGVNDLDNQKYDGKKIADDYFQLYHDFAKKKLNIKFYILSVNPIDEKRINKNYINNHRTNQKIKDFNRTMKEKLKETKLNNMFYCDSYNNLNFDTKDGLHYTQKTNNVIIKFIANKCINFN